jgi:hypothetical protein
VNLLKAASTVSLMTLLSRITGLVREQLVAATFGASAVTDAFNVAFPTCFGASSPRVPFHRPSCLCWPRRANATARLPPTFC